MKTILRDFFEQKFREDMRKRTRKTRTPYDISAQNLEGWLSLYLPIYQSHISIEFYVSPSVMFLLKFLIWGVGDTASAW